MKLLRSVWHRVVGYRQETCQSCHRAVAMALGTWWHAPDSLWNFVEGGSGGIRCARCSVRDCDRLGLLVFFEAVLWQPTTTQKTSSAASEDS